MVNLLPEVQVSGRNGAHAMAAASSRQRSQEGLNSILQRPIGHQFAHAVNEGLTHWTTSRGLNVSDLSRAQKKELVCALADDGAFSGKNAAGYICRLLGMGRATVYNYLNGGTGDVAAGGD